MRAILTVLLFQLTLVQTGNTKKIAVMPFNPQGIEQRVATILDSLVVLEVDDLGTYEVIGATDIKALLGLEGMKQSLGCTDVSCAAELGGALGVDYLLAGVLGRLGSKILITAKIIDVKNIRVLERSSVKMPYDENVFDQGIHRIIQKLFAKLEGRQPKKYNAPAVSDTTSTQSPQPQTIPTQPSMDQVASPVQTTSKPAKRGISNMFWISTASLAAVTLGVGGLFGLQAQKYESQADDLSFDNDISPQMAAQYAQDRAKLANVFLLSGAVLAVASIPLLIFSKSIRTSSQPLAVVPIVSSDTIGAHVSFEF